MVNQKMITNRRIIEQFLLLIFLCSSYDEVRGTKLSKQEDLELENQLKLLNKPAVKTIKTKYGDIYDCVNFYEQPAFDHPLLKNHNYHPQMRPSPSLFMQETASIRPTNIKLPRVECPVGTVPIKRTTKEDLIRHKNLPPSEDTMISENTFDSKRRRKKPLKGYQRAIIHTNDDPSNKFGGAAMTANVYNPHVEGRQSSAARMRITKGKNVIQVGWRVDPILYGDNLTRLFIYFEDGNSSGCFNSLCPGFLRHSREVLIDGPFDSVSDRGGNISEIGLWINWDQNVGNWWLYSSEAKDSLGFWPREVFDKDFAFFVTRVEWGGVVYSPPGVREPPMGSSFFPIKNDNYDAYFRNLDLLNEDGESLQFDNDQLNITIDNPDLYNAINSDDGMMFYGGPGDEWT